MGLISAIKSLLGIGNSRDRSHDGTAGTDVTVERETDASSERAVKESDAEARGTADTGGTDVDGVAETDDGGGAELSFDNETETTPEDGVGSTDEGDDSADGEPVDRIKGIGPSYSEQLTDAGVRTVSDLADADAAELNEATGIGENRIQGWIDRANAR
jgi:predicted flap endonuclease-1-like 5' DNA nuclease